VTTSGKGRFTVITIQFLRVFFHKNKHFPRLDACKLLSQNFFIILINCKTFCLNFKVNFGHTIHHRCYDYTSMLF